MLLEKGKAKFDWKEIPLSKEIKTDHISLDFVKENFGNGFCLNIGNPHIVFFVKNCSKINIKDLGPKIENNKIFPERVNVTFAEILDKENIKVNVWERGAGLTKACGTAACATAVAANLENLENSRTEIEFSLGKLVISIDENQQIHMKGPVSSIKEIDINI